MGEPPRIQTHGGELFYLSASGDMMTVRVETTPTLKVTGVSRLFTPLGFQGGNGSLLYEVSPDGRRFLMLDITAPPSDAASERLVVVRNIKSASSRNGRPNDRRLRAAQGRARRPLPGREHDWGRAAWARLRRRISKHDRKVAWRLREGAPHRWARYACSARSRWRRSCGVPHTVQLPLYDSAKPTACAM